VGKLHRIAQVYGYIVCLVTVLTFLFSVRPLIGAMFDLSDPLHAGGYFPPDLTSFEAYKMDKLKHVARTESEMPVHTPDDEALREMYDAEKADRAVSARLDAKRTLTQTMLTMFVCAVLFATHWVWLRRIARNEIGAAQDVR
jgi:hypothetical protein